MQALSHALGRGSSSGRYRQESKKRLNTAGAQGKKEGVGQGGSLFLRSHFPVTPKVSFKSSAHMYDA